MTDAPAILIACFLALIGGIAYACFAPFPIMPSHVGKIFYIVEHTDTVTVLRCISRESYEKGMTYHLTKNTEDFDFSTRRTLVVGKEYILRKRTNRSLYFEEIAPVSDLAMI